ncbi:MULTISPECIES: hypothetical protein [unclassified Bosea (in: a-proteobacteria)]|uniref:hypothetical protein n=1 Tax=unclassified Bosea (in: a-proteobacteria) TaxID=2653178 RepID=UPI000F7DAEB1|nr:MULTISPECIES: hypothetical protein [unclassified Bosea (in: a-proteobacteria)]
MGIVAGRVGLGSGAAEGGQGSDELGGRANMTDAHIWSHSIEQTLRGPCELTAEATPARVRTGSR